MDRIYTISLRDVRSVPRNKRALKAVGYVRSFIEKHMKSDVVKFDAALNEKIWERGMRNIPAKIKVRASSRDDGSVLVTIAE